MDPFATTAPPGLQKIAFLRRRQMFCKQMKPNSAAILFAAPERQRNSDCNYLYRQDSDFFYFTGFNEPEAVLVLRCDTQANFQAVLFNRHKDPLAETWHGRRLGQVAALSALGVDQAFPFDLLDEQLPLLLNGLDRVYHAQGRYEQADHQVFAAIEKLRQGGRNNWQAPATMTDWRPIVHEMRLFKQPEELAMMRYAAKVSARQHNDAMRFGPGSNEYQVETSLLHGFMLCNARHLAYNSIVASGANACILHYTENDREIADGDLVLVDAGCEYQNYAADITRTWPANGRFSPAQRAIYDLVLTAQLKAIDLLIPGSSIQQANAAAIEIMVTGMVKLGILQGEVTTLIAAKAYRPYYMHGLSHWLGLDVHDVGDYGGADRTRTLEPGMVLTVEPGLYFPPDAEIPIEYRGIGIRIEDDILITDEGNEVLTADAIKDPEAIEAWIQQLRGFSG